MAVAQVEAFYQKVMENEELKEKVMAISGTPKIVAESVVAIAKENGFDVTVEDFKEFYYDQAEMDSDEMEQIAAGRKGHSECFGDWDDECQKVCGEMCGNFLGHYMGRQR